MTSSAFVASSAAVMLGGYLKGGAVTFALAGSLAGVTAASRLIAPRLAPAIVTLGVVQLFGIVGTGHFFGRLPAGSALGLLLAIASAVLRSKLWPIVVPVAFAMFLLTMYVMVS